MNREEKRVRGYALFCAIYREFESSERDGIIYHVILLRSKNLGIERAEHGHRYSAYAISVASLSSLLPPSFPPFISDHERFTVH